MAVFKGNLGFVQKYLMKIEEEGEILKQSLNYEYNLNFARAVVTQTRILNRFDGVPTTFDFKGYQLDASVFINDWSNQGNYQTHQKDFRLLWGQSASYQEGQMFTDVSGLSAISTVKGLQYAYAHPESYTVKKINTANKSEIDNLDLSDNTKANMKADVDQGNTILTPNKIVDSGVWHGLFYVSLSPEWTGTYAIGEQVMGNGAWTTDEMEETETGGYKKEVEVGCDEDQTTPPSTLSVQSTTCVKAKCNFLYKDIYNTSPDTDHFSCLSEDAKVVQDIKLNSEWKSVYGEICNKWVYKFGVTQHVVIVTENAVKFYSPATNYKITSSENTWPGYNYWTHIDTVRNKLNAYGDNYGTVRFTFKIGTFRRPKNNEKSIYYVPKGLKTDLKVENGHVVTINDRLLSFAGSEDEVKKMKQAKDVLINNNYGISICDKIRELCSLVISFMGFPVEDEVAFDVDSHYENKGIYQRFAGGTLFFIDNPFWKVWKGGNDYRISYGQMNIEYDKKGGIYGVMGAPTKVISKSLESTNGDDILFQSYQGNDNVEKLSWHVQDNYVEGSLDDEGIKIPLVNGFFNNTENIQEFTEGLFDESAEYGVYDLAADILTGLTIEKLATRAVSWVASKKAINKTAKLIFGKFRTVFYIISGIIVADNTLEELELYKACTSKEYKIEGKTPSYYCGRLVIHAVVIGLSGPGDYVGKRFYKLAVYSPTALNAKIKLSSRIKEKIEKGDNLMNLLTFYDKTRNTFFKELHQSVIKDVDENIANADLDKIINDPELAERLIKFDVGQRKWDLFHSLLKKRSFVGKTSAEVVNKGFPSTYNPKPYKPKTEVKLFKADVDIEDVFVRVYREDRDNKIGVWIIRKSDIIDPKTGKYLTPEEIRKKFALPETPTHVVKVKMPQSEEFREGLVNHRPGEWQGDVMQYQFMKSKEKLDPTWFYNNTIQSL